MVRYLKTNNITTLLFFCFILFPMCSHHVLIRFSLNPQKVPQVPKLFPNTFPITHEYIPYGVFAQSSSLMYINWKGGPYGAHLFLFCERGASIGRVPNVPKKIGDGPNQRWLLQNKRHEHTHELINRNHTMSIWGNFVQLVGLSFKFFIAI